MPEKPLTIATYAAGASLAAITLVYVFGPTFFLDDEAAQSSRSSRKKGVVGLSNPANDCFINSVLQTLAGLPELRAYLIREVHRRRLEGSKVYAVLAEESDADDETDGEQPQGEGRKSKDPEWKVLGEQKGLVTSALKDVLDSLNERPIYKKTISAQGFVAVLEQVFRTRISRQQQDAQEFLQILTERMSEEYYAGVKARRKANKRGTRVVANVAETTDRGNGVDDGTIPDTASIAPCASTRENTDEGQATIKPEEVVESGFPFQGKIEAQIECSHCHFKPKASVSSFVTLTLHVPQASSATLSACLDGMLKAESIDDFKCDLCRLQHALQSKQRELLRAGLEKTSSLEKDIAAIEHAIATDPENPPKDANLPDISVAPKRTIKRHIRISEFPRVLAIHLSRSMWDAVSSKNTAKVAFPETLPLGGLLDQKSYRLLGVVTHKGGHNSGHYESFRREVVRDPYSTPANLGTQGVYSAKGTPQASVMPSPARSLQQKDSKRRSESHSGTPDLAVLTQSPTITSDSDASLSTESSQSAARSKLGLGETPSAPAVVQHGAGVGAVPLQQLKKTNSVRAKSVDLSRFKRKPKKADNRWWRISDDKIKESKTNDVLSMQREVYLLFYEMVIPETA